MNNSILGKPIQKTKKKQRNIWFVRSKKTRNKLACSINFDGVKHIAGYLKTYDVTNKELVMDIPTDVGQPNLDVSKTFFLKTCHEYMVQNR